MATDTRRALQVEIDRGPEVTVVRCRGSIVIETWAELSSTLRNLIPEGKPIRVDLSNVDMVDSVGIGSFVSVWASAKRADVDLKFRNPGKRVQDLVELTRLFDLFEGQQPQKS